MKSHSIICPLLVSISLFSLFLPPTFSTTQKSYVVYLGSHSHQGEPTLSDVEAATNSHYDLLGLVIHSKEKANEKIIYSYTNNINGFVAVLDEEEVEALRKKPGVVSVFLNKASNLHTTRSWEFLGLEKEGVVPSFSLWRLANYGQDVIIGNLDTGVWPESKSFSDEGMGPIPTKWRGTCQGGQGKNGVRCNRKLIGARYFNKGYAAYVGTKLNSTFQTARDNEGHGSHTLSTAAGRFVPSVNVFGNGNGTAKGGSPNARVAAYKVCWPPINGGECFDADVLAGYDAAISDGVDVLSVSLGGEPQEFAMDAIAIGAFHAVQKGIVVVASAGNSGPDPGSVSNVAPWILTVGASTMDREFTSWIGLGNRKHIKGASLSKGGLLKPKFYPLILGSAAKLADQSATSALLCKEGTLDPKKAKGKIVVCLRGDIGRSDKEEQVLRAGGVGMILANDKRDGNDIIADAHFLPAAHVTYDDGQAVFSYANSTKNPVVIMTDVRTYIRVKPSPFMASFSSRGPNLIEKSILKPDVTAPGVNVIAAYSLAVSPTGEDVDKRRIAYTSDSGTSMSCPHVSGIVGLIKAVHPDWSPAAIRSAIMTSARTRDNKRQPLLDSDYQRATPFSYGSGHVRPSRAVDPGLIYDLGLNDYLNFLCARGYNQTQLLSFYPKPYMCPKSFSLGDFNYPSITVPNLNSSATVTRTVTNVGRPSTYRVQVKQPAGVSVTVEPSSLDFKKTGETKTFKVTIKAAKKNEPADYVFGGLTWTDGTHYVRSPLVVKHT